MDSYSHKPRSGRSNAALALCALLFTLLSLVSSSSRCSAQVDAGSWIVFDDTDSTTIIRADTATIRALMQHYVNGVPAGIDADSAKRVGRSYQYTMLYMPYDTAQFEYVSPLNQGEDYEASGLTVPTPRTLICTAVSITHSWDTTGFRRMRDTTIYRAGWGDSIPAGASWAIMYRSGQLSTTGMQTLRLMYVAKNDLGQTGYVGSEMQIPFIWRPGGWGGYPPVLESEQGVMIDHVITITVEFVEKIPGRTY